MSKIHCGHTPQPPLVRKGKSWLVLILPLRTCRGKRPSLPSAKGWESDAMFVLSDSNHPSLVKGLRNGPCLLLFTSRVNAEEYMRRLNEAKSIQLDRVVSVGEVDEVSLVRLLNWIRQSDVRSIIIEPDSATEVGEFDRGWMPVGRFIEVMVQLSDIADREQYGLEITHLHDFERNLPSRCDTRLQAVAACLREWPEAWLSVNGGEICVNPRDESTMDALGPYARISARTPDSLDIEIEDDIEDDEDMASEGGDA